MRSSGVTEDRHAPQRGLPVRVGWNELADTADETQAAVLNARLHEIVLSRIVPHLAATLEVRQHEPKRKPLSTSDIAAFADAVIAKGPSDAESLFERFHAEGLTAEALVESLLAPTARRLGELWAEDLCDFVDVTFGVNRLRILLETYVKSQVPMTDPRRRALLIATPGEQHLFGLDVVATFLQSFGWETVLESERTPEENAQVAADGWFAIVGLTISAEGRAPAAARAVEAVRRASLNPAIAVMVGGLAIADHESPLRIKGAFTANDGPSAALLAQRLYLAQNAGVANGK